MERYRLMLHPAHLEVEKDGELVKYKDHETEVEILRNIIKDNGDDRRKLRRMMKQLEKEKEWLIWKVIGDKRYGMSTTGENEKRKVMEEMKRTLEKK